MANTYRCLKNVRATWSLPFGTQYFLQGATGGVPPRMTNLCKGCAGIRARYRPGARPASWSLSFGRTVASSFGLAEAVPLSAPCALRSVWIPVWRHKRGDVIGYTPHQ